MARSIPLCQKALISYRAFVRFIQRLSNIFLYRDIKPAEPLCGAVCSCVRFLIKLGILQTKDSTNDTHRLLTLAKEADATDHVSMDTFLALAPVVYRQGFFYCSSSPARISSD